MKHEIWGTNEDGEFGLIKKSDNRLLAEARQQLIEDLRGLRAKMLSVTDTEAIIEQEDGTNGQTSPLWHHRGRIRAVFAYLIWAANNASSLEELDEIDWAEDVRQLQEAEFGPTGFGQKPNGPGKGADPDGAPPGVQAIPGLEDKFKPPYGTPGQSNSGGR